MQKEIMGFIADVDEYLFKMECAIDTLSAIQNAVSEVDFSGEVCGNALFFVYVEMQRNNRGLRRYIEALLRKMRGEIHGQTD